METNSKLKIRMKVSLFFEGTFLRYNVYTHTHKLYICNLYDWMSLVISMHPWNHCHNQGNRHFHHFQNFPCSPLFFGFVCFVFVERTLTMRSTFLTMSKCTILLLTPDTVLFHRISGTTELLSASKTFFEIPHVSGFMQYLSFCNWFFLLSTIFSRFSHVVPSGRISF